MNKNLNSIYRNNFIKFQLPAFVLSTTILVSCASLDEQTKHLDPFEEFNRSVYSFNSNVLDLYLVRPAAVMWRNYVPQPARNGLSNFTSNLEAPAIMVNYFLQGNPYQGMIYFTRFFLNTTLGMGGFIDVAGMANQKLHHEQPHRFGSTLGYYGVGYGPYMYLPIYGSFTIRDDGGDMLDMFYPILSWLTWPLSIGKWIIEGIETRAQLLDSDALLCQSTDPYITVREAYFQYHEFIVNNNKLNSQDNSSAKIIENDLSEIDAELNK